MPGLRAGADAGCSYRFRAGSAVGPYPSAEERGFRTPPATSMRPQSPSVFVEDLPSSEASEMVLNLLRVWTSGLKMDVYEQSTAEDGKTMKTMEDGAQAAGRGATGGMSSCSLVPNLQYPWPRNLTEGRFVAWAFIGNLVCG